MLKCKHALGTSTNEIGEELCFCEIYDQNRNITLGECLGNCECEEQYSEEVEICFADGTRYRCTRYLS